MKILVIGAGMYVTGRGGSGLGTVMASLAQVSRTQRIDEVVVVARRADNAEAVATAARAINERLGTSLSFRYQTIDDARPLGAQLPLAQFGASVVVVPDHAHFAVAAELLEARVPALIVKPLTPTAAEARELIAIQRRTGTYAAVEFHKRWDESNLLARRLIAEGRIGALVYGLVEYSQRIRIPTETFRGWADRTNIFQYLGVHYVDLFYFLTGLQPRRVMAIGTKGVLAARGVDTWDSVHAHIVWSGGATTGFVTHLTINWIDPNTTSALSDQRIKIIGANGRIECDQKDRGIEVVTEREGVQHVNPYFADYLPDEDGRISFQGYGHRSIASFMSDVAALAAGTRTIESLEPIRPTLRQSLVSTAVIDAVNQSLMQDSQWKTIDAHV